MHLLQPLLYLNELVAKFRSMTEMALTTVIGVKSKRSQCFEYWLLYKAAVKDLQGERGGRGLRYPHPKSIPNIEKFGNFPNTERSELHSWKNIFACLDHLISHEIHLNQIFL